MKENTGKPARKMSKEEKIRNQVERESRKREAME